MGPSDLGESCRREICLTLEEMGFEIEASHHECAVAQHEIDFKYSDALSAVDNILTFKMVVKSAADSHGPLRHLHAQAPVRAGRIRNAYQHEPVLERQKRVL